MVDRGKVEVIMHRNKAVVYSILPKSKDKEIQGTKDNDNERKAKFKSHKTNLYSK